MTVIFTCVDGKLGIRTHTKDLPTENLEAMFKVTHSPHKI